MSGMDVGGDESVEWKIWAENVRKGTIKSTPIGDYGYVQGGIDETDDGDLFAISVKMPVDSRAFVESLKKAAEEAEKYAGQPGYLVSFVLPIEKRSYNQLQVRWTSTPPSATKPTLGAKKRLKKKAPKAAAKKVSASKGSKKKGAKNAAKKKAGKKR
jgi:hypothetical protein